MFASILGEGIWSLLPFWGEEFWVWGLGGSSSSLGGEEELLMVMRLDEADQQQQQEEEQNEDPGFQCWEMTLQKNLVEGGWVGWACLWLPFLEGGVLGFSLASIFGRGFGRGSACFFYRPLRWSTAGPRWACWWWICWWRCAKNFSKVMGAKSQKDLEAFVGGGAL